MAIKRVFKNSISTVASSIVNIFVSFCAQRIFLGVLNTEYLGLNSLFTSIISVLAIFELGIGSAITFSLYKPLAQNDKSSIKALMNFYKKAYRIIAVVVTIVGLSIMPFLQILIKDISIDVNVYLVYSLFLIDVVCSYCLTYRRSILYADQKNYIISFTHIGYLIVMNLLQLCILTLTRDYYLYLSVKILFRLLENYIIHLIVRKQYPYLNNLTNTKLDKKQEKSILKRIYALAFHKIGGFIVFGTDSIIISKFIGLAEVGLCSNYLLVTSAAQQLVGQAVTSLTPTVGNKLALESSEKTYSMFQKTRFICFCFACITTTVFITCMQPLIKIWLGEQYLLESVILITIAINLFQRLQRNSYSTFKEAAGIYYEDRYVPLIESALNIVGSILLLQFFGLAGVFIGTTVSGLTLWCYSYPKYVYKKLFKRSYWHYIRETLGYILIFFACMTASSLSSSFFIFDNNILQLVYNAVTSFMVSIFIICLTLHQTLGFRYFVCRTPIIKRIVKNEK